MIYYIKKVEGSYSLTAHLNLLNVPSLVIHLTLSSFQDGIKLREYLIRQEKL